jgi:hypothetical protein
LPHHPRPSPSSRLPSSRLPSSRLPSSRLPSSRPPRRPLPDGEDDEPLVDRGRGLGLRLLALLGALAFVILGISSIAPLLRPVPPEEQPYQRRGPLA